MTQTDDPETLDPSPKGVASHMAQEQASAELRTTPYSCGGSLQKNTEQSRGVEVEISLFYLWAVSGWRAISSNSTKTPQNPWARAAGGPASKRLYFNWSS